MALRTAIIGMGKMGNIRKKELDRHPGFEVTALSDINEDVQKQFPDIPFFRNWDEVLQQPLEAVVVCTYNHIAPDVVCAALDKGMHVFCEKPPGRNVEDVKRIIQAEETAHGKVLKFGFNHRFHYAVMEAKSIVDSKRYGNVMWARGIYGKAGGLSFGKNWRMDPALAGGGILLDQGIHMLDLLRYFLGDFVEIKGFVENCYWKEGPLEDNAFALMKTGEGRVAMVHSSANQWKHKFTLDLFMEDGYVTLNGILSSTRSYGEESITFAKKQFENEASAFGRPREETIYFDVDDSWRFEIEEFYECIQGKKTCLIGSSDDALKVMELIGNIYQEGHCRA
jgi:predicted dehydrogenase